MGIQLVLVSVVSGDLKKRTFETDKINKVKRKKSTPGRENTVVSSGSSIMTET